MTASLWKGKPDVRPALFGGRGKVSVWDLDSAALPAPFEAALGCELSRGGSVGAHVQEHCSELVIVISGRGEARVDGAKVALAPGRVVPVPLGSTLELSNRSKTATLRYLIVKCPG